MLEGGYHEQRRAGLFGNNAECASGYFAMMIKCGDLEYYSRLAMEVARRDEMGRVSWKRQLLKQIVLLETGRNKLGRSRITPRLAIVFQMENSQMSCD